MLSYPIEQLLVKLGLNATERTVYLTGLELGPSTIIQLAAKSDHKRLTVHQAVMSMIEQGIFLQTYYGKKRLFYPNNYDGLRLLVEEKKFALRQLEQELDGAKTVFDAITTSRSTMANTRLYQGIEGINTTLVEMARDRQPIAIIYDAHSLNNLIDEKLFHRSYTKRTENLTPTRLIMPHGFRDYRHLERTEDSLVSIKTLPQDKLFQGGIEIRGSKIALHCYSAGLITTTLIDNPAIAGILLALYESMRTQAKDYQEQFLMV